MVSAGGGGGKRLLFCMLPTLPRALALTGLAAGEKYPWSGGPRREIDWALSLGVRAVQLDATVAGLRARELDGAARRDLVAVLRRGGAEVAGLDLFVPPRHLTDPAFVDRAVSAIVQGLELAADLGRIGGGARPAVSTLLPTDLGEDVVSRLGMAAEHQGVVLADHGWPRRARHGGLVSGVDPAVVYVGGGDPLMGMVEAPGAARLSDVASIGRCEAGKGRLDIGAYEATLYTCGYRGFLAVDLRGLARQESVARVLLG